MRLSENRNRVPRLTWNKYCNQNKRHYHQPRSSYLASAPVWKDIDASQSKHTPFSFPSSRKCWNWRVCYTPITRRKALSNQPSSTVNIYRLLYGNMVKSSGHESKNIWVLYSQLYNYLLIIYPTVQRKCHF